MVNKSNKTLLGTGIITAIAASLCCITPVLALVAGTSGLASSFSWMEPFRPYLIVLTVVVLAFAWVQKLKKRPADDIACDCETDEKTPFTQSKSFLGIVTLVAIVMMAFPYYSEVFFPSHKKEIVYVKAANVKTLRLNMKGMTCPACNYTIQNAALELNGVLEAKADYKTGIATIRYDETKASPVEVIQAIEKTNYIVKNKHDQNQHLIKK